MSSIRPEVNLESLQKKIQQLEAKIEKLEINSQVNAESITIIVTTGDYDKLMSAFILATGAVSMGMEASIFFSFWGITALKKSNIYKKKSVLQKLMTVMLPNNAEKTPMSKFNMMGMGKGMMNVMMKRHNVKPLNELVEIAQELNVRLISCQMTMDLMGISKEELIDGVEYAGVGTCLECGSKSNLNFYI